MMKSHLMFKRYGTILFALGLCVLTFSCADSPKAQPQVQASCHYTATCPLTKSVLPSKLYFFPPLLCDAKGKPKESLKPVQEVDGGITDWVTPNQKSKAIRDQLETYFTSIGYQVVTFKDVLAAREPHEILIVSSFYSAPLPVVPAVAGKLDQYVLSMIKAKTFDLDLDPRKSKDIASIDGLSFFSSTQKPNDIESKSFGITIRWLGDNVSGIMNLEP